MDFQAIKFTDNLEMHSNITDKKNKRHMIAKSDTDNYSTYWLIFATKHTIMKTINTSTKCAEIFLTSFKHFDFSSHE